MSKYYIEQKIETLAENSIGVEESQSRFELDNIIFEQWEFNHRDGWLGNAWLAKATIEATSVTEAYQLFRAKLVKIIPRVSFVSQCYIEFGTEPFLIRKEEADAAYFYDIQEVGGVGLMFDEPHLDALRKLTEADIPEEFFLFWNEAVNTTGYSPKLLVMFSALEALAKKPNGSKDHERLELILGKELKDDIFKQTSGLRNRLVHGEHFLETDFRRNFVEGVHRAVVGYFNQYIFGKGVISLDTVSPHRRLSGNKEVGRYFIEPINDAQLDLKSVLRSFNAAEDRLRNPDYNLVSNQETDNY